MSRKLGSSPRARKVMTANSPVKEGGERESEEGKRERKRGKKQGEKSQEYTNRLSL
jgi:hypothetical protein